ncbi:MAG: winged helix-turn-helix domain-containing protein, partial [Kiritimatiellae bacterium]|nr:winged helix-turn-helix domain-containing protein [Kiritimatiellia bacterium]
MDIRKRSVKGLPALVAKPIIQQVADHLREHILSGRFAANSRLPSNRELAVHLSIPRSTVNAAVSLLAREGWLRSLHGSGTYVRERPPQLRTIASYFYGDGLCAPEARFYRALQQQLQSRIEAAGKQWSVWTDPRPTD